jgi:polyisoprenyl-teichoic acid--peptidoglycan teichoic acid transferase
MARPDLDATERIPILEPEAAPQQQPRSALTGLLRVILRLALLVLIAIAALVAAALFLTPTKQSILIMGSDARPDELQRGEVGRTDTLELLAADRARPRVALISVPRDLWVTIPGYGQERINAAYELGGSQTAKQTVSNVLAQPVDRYVLIGLQGVRDVVDAVGGVDITVPQAIHDDAYPTDDYGYQTIDIPAGRQHMNGETALEYARTRHQDSDFGRAARQQQVIAAVRNALLNPLNWPRAPAVLLATQRSVRTDVGPLDSIALVAAFLRSPGDPDRMLIDTSLATETTGVDGAYLLEPKPDLKPAVARFLGGASVEVLNAAGVAGLAGRTADRLTQNGFVVTNVADATQPSTQTIIQAKAGARSAAERIANLLNIPTSRISENTSTGQSDIRLILGSDAR